VGTYLEPLRLIFASLSPIPSTSCAPRRLWKDEQNIRISLLSPVLRSIDAVGAVPEPGRILAMKKASNKAVGQRRRKQESISDRLERLSGRVAPSRFPFESGDSTGRSSSGPPYRKIIE
jgi:hypothetical protein